MKMRTKAFFILLWFLMAGCQAVGPAGPSAVGFGPGQESASDQNPGTLNATPPTTSSTPVFVSTPGRPSCVGSLCFVLGGMGDPEECPGEQVLAHGILSSSDKGIVWENVEVTFQYAGGSATTRAKPLLSFGEIDGEYTAFLGARPGDSVKISISRKDHPEEPILIKEYPIPSPLDPYSLYQESCPRGYADQNPVLQGLPVPNTPRPFVPSAVAP